MGYDANVKAVLEFENNVTDTIGTYTWTNENGVPFSNTIYKYGAYSAGRFDPTVNANMAVRTTVTDAIKTIEFNVYWPTGHNDSNRYVYCTASGSPALRIQGQSGKFNFYGAGLIVSETVSPDTWYHFAITFSGTQVKVYKDNTLIGTETNGYVPTNTVHTIGNYAGLTVAFDGYIDRVVLSSDVRTSFPTLPISEPTITDISPATGSTAGGTAVTITGTEFATGATVTFGGVSATDIVIVSATEITCVTPAGTAGAVDVVVTNTDTGTVTSAGGFTYVSVGAKSIGTFGFSKSRFKRQRLGAI